MPEDGWDAVYANLTDQVGTTWGDYVAMLNENMNYLYTVGQEVDDVKSLWNFEIKQAAAALTGCGSPSVIDAYSPGLLGCQTG